MEEEENFGEKTMILAPSALRGSQETPTARLVCVDPGVLPDATGSEVLLNGDSGDVNIGRGEENTVPVKADGVSRMHARFFPSGDMWGVEDLGSTNGVKVNDTKVHETWLKHGDFVQLGTLKYQYLIEGKEAPPAKAEKVDLDLTGAGDKTVLMKPSSGKAPAASPKPAAAAKTAPQPAARAKAAPAPSKAGGGPNIGLWLMVAGVLMLIGVIAAAFL